MGNIICKTKEYLDTALGDKNGGASCYGNLRTVFHSLGEYGKAKEYLEKALAIRKEIHDKNGVASSHGNLGTMFLSLGEYVKDKKISRKSTCDQKRDWRHKRGSFISRQPRNCFSFSWGIRKS